jgi:hypothetical protein
MAAKIFRPATAETGQLQAGLIFPAAVKTKRGILADASLF